MMICKKLLKFICYNYKIFNNNIFKHFLNSNIET